MKLYQLINKEKMLLSFIKFSQLIIRKMFGDKSGKFACAYWSLGVKERRIFLKVQI